MLIVAEGKAVSGFSITEGTCNLKSNLLYWFLRCRLYDMQHYKDDDEGDKFDED